MLINVKIEKNTLKNMLYERLNWWNTDNETYKNVENYFLKMIEDGGFEDAELDIKEFIDNLVTNYDWNRENDNE